ncbi:Proteophosphoglycan 5 [Rhodotorula toruloides]|nr:Proteophosphoglycan 5 [Rhodotorula toruloides]
MEAEPTTPAGATSGQSLLDTAHSLQTLLTTRLASSSSSLDASTASLHPLSATPPTSVPELRAALASTVSTLRAGISQFSSLALPQADSATGEETKDVKARRDRYLTLLRDAAGTESSLLASRKEDAERARRVLKRRRREYEGVWEVTTPRTSGAEGPTVLSVLEGLAKDLELVTFRDDDGIDGGRKDGPVTLSVGGKVMVVDFEVVGEMDVAKVKVAYVVDGLDLQCSVAADKLHALLRRSEEEKGDEAVRQRCWRGVKTLLEQLKELDEATERLGQDCFTALNRTLPGDLDSVFPAPATQANAESVQLPLLLPTPSSLQPRLLYHATPYARLTSSFATAISSAISPTKSSSSTPPPKPSLRQQGVYTLRISLAAIEDDLDAAKTDSQTYLATLDPPVPFEAATGRAVCEALSIEKREADEGAENDGPRVRNEGRDLLDLVLSLAGDERTDTSQRTFETTIPSSSADSALTICFTAALPVGSTSQPAFLATHLRFKQARQLRDALKVLEAQVRVNELVKSIVLGTEAKRVRDAPSADSPLTLPVSLHFPSPTPSPASSLSGPSLALSFPFPLFSRSSSLTGIPLALSITSPFPFASSSDERTYSVFFAAPPAVVEALGGAEGKEVLEKRVEKVLEVTGNMGLGLREVVRELRKVVE